jgi:hypothetical protein
VKRYVAGCRLRDPGAPGVCQTVLQTCLKGRAILSQRADLAPTTRRCKPKPPLRLTFVCSVGTMMTDADGKSCTTAHRSEAMPFVTIGTLVAASRAPWQRFCFPLESHLLTFRQEESACFVLSCSL